MQAEARTKTYRKQAEIFSALGKEIRLQLVAQLCEKGPMSITELAARHDMSRQAVTKHLRVLEDAELLRGSRRGRQQVWKLEEKRLEIAKAYLELISNRWDGALEKLRKLVEE